MTSRKARACFYNHLRASAQDLAKNIEIPLLGEAYNIERRLHLAAHGVNIAQRIRGRDPSECIWILYHRRKEIQRLNKSDIIRQPVNRRVILA